MSGAMSKSKRKMEYLRRIYTCIVLHPLTVYCTYTDNYRIFHRFTLFPETPETSAYENNYYSSGCHIKIFKIRKFPILFYLKITDE